MALSFSSQAGRNRRAARRQARQDRRLARSGQRQAARGTNVSARQTSKTAAYKAGIDPNAWVGGAIDKGLDVASHFLTKESSSGDGSGKGKGSGGEDDNTLLIVAALAGAYYLSQK